MERYISPIQVDDTKGPNFYKSTIPQIIPQEDVPFYYTAIDGDRLDSLANLFYKNTQYWWVIAKANNLVTGNMTVPVGTKLFIPNV